MLLCCDRELALMQALFISGGVIECGEDDGASLCTAPQAFGKTCCEEWMYLGRLLGWMYLLHELPGFHGTAQQIALQ